MIDTSKWERQPAYENVMARSVGMMMSCNSCDRIIWEDENWIEGYQNSAGYCKECSEEANQSNLNQ
jgi:hypothetical protein